MPALRGKPAVNCPGRLPRSGVARVGTLLVLSALGFSLLGFVLSAERVLHEIAEVRDGTSPIQVTVELGESGEDAGRHLWVDLHPRGGWRVVDEQGTQWSGQGPWTRRTGGEPPPAGLALAWLLAVSDQQRLSSMVGQLGVDLRLNQLGRCGEGDCFVLGGRDGAAQLWVEKDRFEVRRYQSPRGWTLEFEDYRQGLGRLRIPSQLRLVGPEGSETRAHIVGIEPAPELERDPELLRLGLGSRWAPERAPEGVLALRPSGR